MPNSQKNKPDRLIDPKKYMNMHEIRAQEYPDLMSPEERVEYQKDIYNGPTTEGSLAVERSQGRGVRYAKINGRVRYRKKDIDWHFQYIQYIETLESQGAEIEHS